jgi:hypothetical protein
MALWSVRRIASQAPAASTLLCMSNEEAVTVTLYDSDTNTESVITLCHLTAATDPCELLTLLSSAGYTPADWDTACGL